MIRSISYEHGDLVATMVDGSREYLYRSIGHMWIPRIAHNSNSGNPPSNTAEPSQIAYVTASMVEAAVTSVGGSLSAMLATSQQIAGMFNDAINKLAPSSFRTKARLACLVGQCAQETDWFKTFSEYGGASASYAPYYGRGMIQLTWRDNYARFGQWLAGMGVVNDANMFVNNPDLLTQSPYPAYSAVFYFTQTYFGGIPLVDYCDTCGGVDTGDWAMISRGINRGNVYATAPAYGEGVRNTATNAVLAVTPEVGSNSSDSSLGRRAVDYGMSVQRKFYYSQDSWVRSNMLQSGGGDCSSFVVLCYTQGAGLSNEDMGGNGTYPGYTGTLANVGEFINDTGDESRMLPGDWMCLTYSGYNATYDHVVLYIGNGQCLSHGSGQGPNVESFTWYVQNSSHRVVRGFR